MHDLSNAYMFSIGLRLEKLVGQHIVWISTLQKVSWVGLAILTWVLSWITIIQWLEFGSWQS